MRPCVIMLRWYFNLIVHRHLTGLLTHCTGYGICPVQCRTTVEYIQNSNIIEGGSHLQTRSYSTLFTPRLCMTLQFFGYRNVNDQRFADNTLKKIILFPNPLPPLREPTKNLSRHRGKPHKETPYLQVLWTGVAGPRRLKVGLCSKPCKPFSAIFWLCDIVVALR